MKMIQKGLIVIVSLLILSSCGMTEELDQAKNTLEELQTSLKTQEKLYKKMENQIQSSKQLLTKELEKDPELENFEKNSKLQGSLTDRQQLLKEMNEQNNSIQKSQKNLLQIFKRKAVDVPNDKLKTIAQSIEVIDKNFETYQILLESGLEQEKEFYETFSSEEEKSQQYLIDRTYGSAHTISEEAEENINYTLNLSKNFKSILKEKQE